MAEHAAATMPIGYERRRLAANVVCMWDDVRAPVANARRRGRLPRSVTPLRRVPRLRPGATCEVVGNLQSAGARVVLLCSEWDPHSPILRWQCEVVAGTAYTQTTEGLEVINLVWIDGNNLRRVWTGGRHG